jgi:hypothetical protein
MEQLHQQWLDEGGEGAPPTVVLVGSDRIVIGCKVSPTYQSQGDGGKAKHSCSGGLSVLQPAGRYVGVQYAGG